MESMNNIQQRINEVKQKIIEPQQRLIEKQQQLIQAHEERENERRERIKKVLDDFNNQPHGEALYQKDLKEKVDIHKYRVKAYNQFIFKNGMQEFTNLLIKANQSDYLQNFYEFIDFCDEDVKAKITEEFRKRELEMMKSVYMDFMPLLNPEKVVNHMVYLDEDFGETLNVLDELIKND